MNEDPELTLQVKKWSKKDLYDYALITIIVILLIFLFQYVNLYNNTIDMMHTLNSSFEGCFCL